MNVFSFKYIIYYFASESIVFFVKKLCFYFIGITEHDLTKQSDFIIKPLLCN